MQEYAKIMLSGSSDGTGILIAQITTPGTLIHTAVSGIINSDEIWLYAQNNHTADLALYLEYGGVAGKDIIQFSLPYKKGLYLFLPGLVLNNSKIVRAYAQTANLITVHGYAHRLVNT